jgi:hypothetical protein
MCAMPSSIPVSVFSDNCATLEGLIVKLAFACPRTFPLMSARAAESVACSPTCICALSESTISNRTIGATMNVAASDFPSIDAEIVAEPARLASATPPLTVAIDWSDDVHVMVGD